MNLLELERAFPEEAVLTPTVPDEKARLYPLNRVQNANPAHICTPHMVWAENDRTGLMEQMMMDEHGDIWPISGYDGRFMD